MNPEFVGVMLKFHLLMASLKFAAQGKRPNHGKTKFICGSL